MSVRRSDVQGSITEAVRHDDPGKNIAMMEAENAAVELEGRQQFFRLQFKWSWVIVVWISVLIIFNIWLTRMVGEGTLNFSGMEWFVTVVTVETFLQVVGLGYVAAKFLFSR